MTLELTSLAGQVKSMSSKLKLDDHDRRLRRSDLERVLQEESADFQALAEKVERSWETCTWLLARPCEALKTSYSTPGRPPGYTVIAVDGSQLDTDRHEMPMCYMVNIGSAVLQYGEAPAASLESNATLFYEDEDLFLDDGVHRVPIQGPRLAARRDVEECRALAALAEREANRKPALALIDGTLIRWALESSEEFVREHFLGQYLACLGRLRQIDVPVASYISRPGSSELVGTLKVGLCPDHPARCKTCSSRTAEGAAACSALDGFADRHIFEFLRDGQRSGVFRSMSKINVRKYGEHRVHFFYMAVGGEVARVEVPEWVAGDQQRLDLIHAILQDQCTKGQGYPVALARAHEKAVITAADRRSFLDLMHAMLRREGLQLELSRKIISKQVTAV